MRRVTRKPIVTAGLKCPEMRIVAVTMMARMSPWASATSSRPTPIPLFLESMIAAPPTKTSAKMPMNSAAKWRRGSFICREAPEEDGEGYGATRGRERCASRLVTECRLLRVRCCVLEAARGAPAHRRVPSGRSTQHSALGIRYLLLQPDLDLLRPSREPRAASRLPVAPHH